MPGNPYTRPIMRVTEEHRQAWPKQYEAFKAGREIATEGTPLEAWPRVQPKQLHELKALGFKTVEQIASMDDQAAGRVGTGGRDLRRVAQAFLNDAARMAAVERLAAENDTKNAEIQDLRLKLHGLEQTLERVVANKETAELPV
jgi:nucleotidyltransferase/DNA polymerase involved in DNA repair